LGESTIGLNEGDYTIRTMPVAGVLFADMDFSVTGDGQTVIVAGMSNAILPPSTPGVVLGWLVARNAHDNPEPNVKFQFRIKEHITQTGTGYSRTAITVASNADGLVEFEFRPSTEYEGRRGVGQGAQGTGGWYPFTTPASGVFAIRSIIGQPTS
jgi:hypothetical protein